MSCQMSGITVIGTIMLVRLASLLLLLVSAVHSLKCMEGHSTNGSTDAFKPADCDSGETW